MVVNVDVDVDVDCPVVEVTLPMVEYLVDVTLGCVTGDVVVVVVVVDELHTGVFLVTGL